LHDGDLTLAELIRVPFNQRVAAMTAKIFALNPEVREAALDVRAVRRKIKESGARSYEWRPAEANARARMVSLSLEHGGNRQEPISKPQPRLK
jgi:hypothetical protein